MSIPLTPSLSSSSTTTSNSSLISLSPFLTDSHSSTSSLSQTHAGSSRPRYARRRNIATFISHSDSEEEEGNEDYSHRSRTTSQNHVTNYGTQLKVSSQISKSQYTPRSFPTSSLRQIMSLHDSDYRPPVHQSSEEHRTASYIFKEAQESQTSSSFRMSQAVSQNTGQDLKMSISEAQSFRRETNTAQFIPAMRAPLARTKSLPHRKAGRVEQNMAEDEEEECENLPSHLLPRKRGVEETEEGEGAGDQDVGAEGDDEESGSQPSVGYSQTIIDHARSALQIPSSQTHAKPKPRLPPIPAIAGHSSGSDTELNELSCGSSNDQAINERVGIWEDFWAPDQQVPLEPVGPSEDIDIAKVISEEAVSKGKKSKGEGDGGEGDVLARLLARAEKMRRGEDPLNIIAGDEENENLEEEDEDDGLLMDDLEEDFDDLLVVGDGQDGSSRRLQALAFLESIPLKFLSQLNTSLVLLNDLERTRLIRKSRSKRQSSDNEASQSQGDHIMLEDPDELEMEETQGGRKGRKGDIGGARSDNVGIEMGFINRKTRVDQVVSFPDDPSTPGKAPSQRRFAEIMRVASLMYEAILSNTVTTKRDIFYKDVGLFRVQATVDKLVDDIAASAGLKRQDFMVCATSKGLIASSCLKVYLQTGEELSFSSTNASLIPPIERIDRISSTSYGIDWVLIVEKDAVFQTLCGNALLGDSCLGSGVIITGKGYPDLATLQLVSLIATTFPAARFHALVDADPHGLDILSVYTNGSKATTYSMDHADLALGERLEWMGVKASEWSELGVSFDDLLPLSEKDVQKAIAMLTNRPEMPDTWRRELVHMLHLNRKAEIQVLAMREMEDEDVEEEKEEGHAGYGDQDGENRSGAATPGGRNGVVRYVMEKLRA